MNDYRRPDALRQDLPHWDGRAEHADGRSVKLSDMQWEEVCNRIGWLTFEDIVSVVTDAGSLAVADTVAFRTFFTQRGIVLTGQPPAELNSRSGGHAALIRPPLRDEELRY